MGRVRKSPVLGSTLMPTIRSLLLLSKSNGSAGRPATGGGEKRSPRHGACTRLTLETSKKSLDGFVDRGGMTGVGPIATTSSSELSLLISTTEGLLRVRALEEDEDASPEGDRAVGSEERDSDRAERIEDTAEPADLRLRAARSGSCAGDADLLEGPAEYALLVREEALLDGREPATTVGRGSGESWSTDPSVDTELGIMERCDPDGDVGLSAMSMLVF